MLRVGDSEFLSNYSIIQLRSREENTVKRRSALVARIVSVLQARKGLMAQHDMLPHGRGIHMRLAWRFATPELGALGH